MKKVKLKQKRFEPKAPLHDSDRLANFVKLTCRICDWQWFQDTRGIPVLRDICVSCQTKKAEGTH